MKESRAYVPRTMDRLISIERGTQSRDNSGAEILTWSVLCTRYADLINQAGMEHTSSEKETAVRESVFTTRYISGLTAKDRIAYDGSIYDIVQINELGRRHYHEIITEIRI